MTDSEFLAQAIALARRNVERAVARLVPLLVQKRGNCR